MVSRIIAAIGILVGGLATILNVLVAFGVDLTDAQTASLQGLAGLLLLIVSAIASPDVPIGPSSGNPPSGP